MVDATAGAAEPQVDFYVLEARDEEGVRRFACRLAEKVWRAGHRVWIEAASTEMARALDAELWTFREESFVPHALAGSEAHDTPVLIGHGEEPEHDPEVLINLAAEVPRSASRAGRIAEIVGADEASRSAGRERFRSYRARGCTPRSHTIGGAR